jgi:hypothetical protein
MHLDDVPLSDFDDADDEGGGEGGRMRPSSGKFTPAKNQPPDDGLTPMERAMKRAAEHRAAREADVAAAAAARGTRKPLPRRGRPRSRRGRSSWSGSSRR